MARRTPPPYAPAQYEKSPHQLEQWAAYEAITARRAQEASQLVESQLDARSLLNQSSDWQKAEDIRSFVAATMSKVAADSNESTLDAAMKWKAFALGIADGLDEATKQAASFSIKPSVG